ncbi:MAG: putative Ig domain-containing protein, partial [Deltaproteobacteria bacterium]|nr:putative Ig domain-containing protein [Deltaproteobacteria bacterium]
MTKRLALTLAGLAAIAGTPSLAKAQGLYVASPPSTATAPTYAGWTSFSFSDDDGGVATLTSPFPFVFYGQPYTSFDVTTDGIILFENRPQTCAPPSVSSTCYANKSIPTAGAPNAMIAFWWDDMELPSQAGQWTVAGNYPSRVFSIKLANWERWNSGGARSVQVDLHEGSGAIAIYYGALTGSGTDNASVGIENIDGTDGVVGLTCTNTSSFCSQSDWPAGKVVMISPAIDPELLVTDVVGTPLATVPGNPNRFRLDVAVTVKNQGEHPAEGFGFDLYLCNQAQLVTDDPTKCTLLRQHTTLQSLAGHESGTWTETGLEFDRPASGTFYLGAYVDPPTAGAPQGNVAEALETNNTRTSMGYLVGVDLSGSLAGPTNAGAGDEVAMEVTIRNSGTDPAAAAFSYELWIATSTTLSRTNDKLFYTGTVSAIAGGETLQLLPPARLPTSLSDGTYYFHLVIDYANTVPEVNNGNNAARASAPVSLSSSDLLVKDVRVRSTVAPYPDVSEAFFEEDVRVTFTVQNAGGGTARNFYVCLVLSDTPTITLFDLAMNMTPADLPELNALTYVGGETHALEIEATIPARKTNGKPIPEGLYYVGVIANCRNTMTGESNLSNNLISAKDPVHIRQPAMDLTPVQVQAPAAGAVGEVLPTFRVLRNMGNRGNADLASSAPFKYRYYLSSNEFISVEDIPLSIVDAQGETRTEGEGRLAPGESDRATDLVFIPPLVSPGTYYVGVVVDPEGEFFELDEANNALASLGNLEIVASSLRIETSSLPDGLVGVDYLQQLVASGGDGTYAWSVMPDQGELPAGLTLSAEGEISGVPSAPEVAVFTVQVSSPAHPAAGTPARVTLARLALRTVDPSGALAILSSRLPTAIRNADYSVNLSAVGGVRPYVWLMHEGVLPDGLTLDQSGKISGKLTKVFGNTTFKVSVTDAFGTRVVGELSMRAVEAGTLFVATDSLGKAQIGVAYQQKLRAVGGTTPYSWSITGGALPDGLRLSGDVLLGTPKKAGFFPLVVEVADSAGYTDSAAFILTVLSRSAAFTLPELPQVKPGEFFSVNLSLQAKPRSVFQLYAGELPSGLTLDSEGRLEGTVAEDAVPRSYDSILLVTEENGAQALVPMTIRVVAKPVTVYTTSGGGCSAAGAGLFPLLGLLFALPLFARRRRSVAVSVALLALGVAAPALADYRVGVSSSTPFQPLVGGTTVLLDPTRGDATVALPFGFRFWGESYSEVQVACRGYLAFGVTGVTATKPQSMGIPSTAAAFPLIAPWWGSWECLPGAITYKVTGVAPQRVMTFQWERAWYTPDTSGKAAHGATFQARLYETTARVEFAYGPSNMSQYVPPTEDKAPRAAVGIQSSGTVGLPGLPCTAAQPATGSGANCLVSDYAPNTVVSFTQPADLTLTRVYADDTGYAGVPLRMGVTVLNQGGEEARNVAVRFFLSSDTSLDIASDTALGTTRGMDVDVQQRRDVLLSPTLPSTLSGSAFYLFAVVDPDNGIAEDLEANNRA